MAQALDLRTVLILLAPSALWAANAVLARYAMALVSPLTLNFLRWAVALLLLLPLGGWVLRRRSLLWQHWRRFAVLGLMGIAAYSALLFMALSATTTMNVALISTIGPVCSLLVGACFFGQPVAARQLLGALVSILGVAVVLTQGDWHELARLRLAPGDAIALLAVLVWSCYGWLLSRTTGPAVIRGDWAALQLAQVVFGVGWAALIAGAEFASGTARLEWGWPLALMVGFVAVAPTIVAFRFWTIGIQRAGAPVVAYFGNLFPLFAALLSTVVLGEPPRGFHALAFVLIVGGIVLGAWHPRSRTAGTSVPPTHRSNDEAPGP